MEAEAKSAVHATHDFAMKLGIPLPEHRIVVFQYHDIEALAASFEAATGRTLLKGGAGRDFAEGNSIAVAGRKYIALNTSAGDYSSTPSINRRKIWAHEMFHIYQYDMSGLTLSSSEGAVPPAGPRWLGEGTAEFLAWQAMEASELGAYAANRTKYVLRSKSVDTGLIEAEIQIGFSSLRGHAYPYAFLAVELLAAQAGLSSLIDYYSSLHAGTSWQAEFQNHFGMTVEDFYEIFEGHRGACFPRYDLPIEPPESPAIPGAAGAGTTITEWERFIPWLSSPPNDLHSRAKDSLICLQAVDPELGASILAMFWVVDGINENELNTIERIPRVAALDPQMASLFLTFDWIVDGLNDHEWVDIEDFAYLLDEDQELARALVDSTGRSFALRLGLDEAGFQTRHPWLADGIAGHELGSLVALSRIFKVDPGLATQIMDYQWARDSISLRERWFVRNLGNISRKDAQLLRRVLGYLWSKDGMNTDEILALESMGRIFWRYQELTNRISRFSWVEDGITTAESDALNELANFLRREPESPLPNDIGESISLAELRQILATGS